MTNRQKIFFYFLISLLLAAVYPFDLDFPTGNQCIYFFWALKNTGFGFLENDFLATQPDPFPLFSWLAAYSYKLSGNSIFLFWYWLLNFIYVVAFFEITEEIRKQLRWQTPSLVGRAGEGCLFLFLHSTQIWGFFFSHFFNFDLRWVWDSGFAEQGILRGYFQPSVFGVFIFLAVAFFLKRKHLIAFSLAALAACFHANYFLVSGIIVFVFVVFLLKEKNYKSALTGSSISLLIVLPYLIYSLQNFGNTSPETEDYIRNNIEGHIHFDYREWMNAKAFFQLTVILYALWLVRKTILFLPLFFAMGILIVLTIVTYVSGSIFLLNLTPWRISVVLVPVATAIVIARVASTQSSTVRNLLYSIIFTFALSALVFRIFGNNSTEFMFKWKTLTVLIFVLVSLKLVVLEKHFSKINFKITYAPVAIFLLTALGVSSFTLHKKHTSGEDELKTFVVKNLKENQAYLIPPQMTDFRLATGVPVFADSNIYFSNALMEWDRRLKIVQRLYEQKDSVLLDSLSKNCGITHIIAGKETGFKAQKEIFSNKRYTIFELNEQ